MERHFQHELDRVRQSLLEMGGRVEEMISQTIESLVERDDALAERVIVADKEIDRLELDIDEACYGLMVRFQPTAKDLRLLIAVMKIVTDLERIGDSAVNIAQSVQQLNQHPRLKPYIDLPRMAELVTEMLHDSLDAFVSRDPEKATAVCKSDDEVDALYKQLFRELLSFMLEDPTTTTRALHLLLVARNLERIADHSTNVAEDVIYYVEGRDVRHSVTVERSTVRS